MVQGKLLNEPLSDLFKMIVTPTEMSTANHLTGQSNGFQKPEKSAPKTIPKANTENFKMTICQLAQTTFLAQTFILSSLGTVFTKSRKDISENSCCSV